MSSDIENDEQNNEPELKKMLKTNDSIPVKTPQTANMESEFDPSDQLACIDDYVSAFEENKSDISKMQCSKAWDRDCFTEYNDYDEPQVQENQQQFCEIISIMRLYIVSIKMDLKQLDSFNWSYPDMFSGIVLKDFLNQVLFLLQQERSYYEKEREYFMLGPQNSKLKKGQVIQQLLQTKGNNGNLLYNDFLLNYDKFLKMLLVRKTFHIPFEEVMSLFEMWSNVFFVLSKLPHSVERQELEQMKDLINLLDCPSSQDRDLLLDLVQSVSIAMGFSMRSNLIRFNQYSQRY